eukprot:scaffold29448_cov31-Tisochrysis_lutea.AAC.3
MVTGDPTLRVREGDFGRYKNAKCAAKWRFVARFPTQSPILEFHSPDPSGGDEGQSAGAPRDG